MLVKTVFNERVAGWRVVVVRFDDTTPIVTAVRWEPEFRIEQTMMDGASPTKVRAWATELAA